MVPGLLHLTLFCSEDECRDAYAPVRCCQSGRDAMQSKGLLRMQTT